MNNRSDTQKVIEQQLKALKIHLKQLIGSIVVLIALGIATLHFGPTFVSPQIAEAAGISQVILAIQILCIEIPKVRLELIHIKMQEMLLDSD